MQKYRPIKNSALIIFFFFTFACKFTTKIIEIEPYIIEITNDNLKNKLKKIYDYDTRDQKVYNYIEDTFYMIDTKNISHIYNETFIGFNTYITKNIADNFKKFSFIKSITRVHVDKNHNQKSINSSLKHIKFKKKNIHLSQSTQKTAWIIDSGISKHQDLNLDISRSKNFTKNKNNKTDDEHGHGTHVAGIIAGKNQGKAPGAKVVPIKITNKKGKGSITDALKGLDYAAFAAEPGDVINMSINGPYYKIFEKAVVHTAQKNIYVVLAAGNNGKKMKHKDLLTSIFNQKNVYIVSSINSKNELALSSNYAEYNNCYAAPGENIWSTWKNNKYKELSGTSMAAPYISGLLIKNGEFSSKKKFFSYPNSNKKIQLNIY